MYVVSLLITINAKGKASLINIEVRNKYKEVMLEGK